MADFDLFNGDADGIFALLQLRQVDPRPQAALVTGVKRDTVLFPQIIDAVRPGDRVTALDIGLVRNISAVQTVLHAGLTCSFATITPPVMSPLIRLYRHL